MALAKLLAVEPGCRWQQRGVEDSAAAKKVPTPPSRYICSIRLIGAPMVSTPTRRSFGSARDAAEAAFKSATSKPATLPDSSPGKAPSLPHAKEQVSIRLDREVLERFQEGGPGWQDRINAALRKALGL